MPAASQKKHVIAMLDRNGRIIFTTRMLRLFGYGMVAVVLMLYLTDIGLSQTEAGLLMTLALLGDTLISLWITTRADRLGRRNMLWLAAGRIILAGAVLALTGNFILLAIAVFLGVISPSGHEAGPFLAIEQAAISHLVPESSRTAVFAWYNLAGSVATALGALATGLLVYAVQAAGFSILDGYRIILIAFALIGGLLMALFSGLTPAIETPVAASSHSPDLLLGLHRSRRTVFKLSALFSLDAFGGGFVLQALMAYWFHIRFGVSVTTLGIIFFAANILAGISALAASRLAHRIGLINTMVFTHIPSNILLIMVPLMPNLPLAITVLLARFSISQMDVPTRQAYTMAVVDPDERSAAAGITHVARSTGAAISPLIAAPLLAIPALANLPFFIAGGLKVIYDLTLWRNFRRTEATAKIGPPEIATTPEDAGIKTPAESRT